jgi:hypothetical protein
VLFKKLVEQHRTDRVVTDGVDFAVHIMHDEIVIHLGYFLSNQANSGVSGSGRTRSNARNQAARQADRATG